MTKYRFLNIGIALVFVATAIIIGLAIVKYKVFPYPLLESAYNSLSHPTASYSVSSEWLHLNNKIGDIPSPGNSNQQTASLILDIDQDGLNDIVIGARKQAPSLVWYKREAAGWQRNIIDSSLLPIEAGGAFYDIDRDGDLDIVMGEDYSGNHVYWWQNPLPNDPTEPWKRYIIKKSGANKHHDQIFGDFDGDGNAELAFWNQLANQLLLAEIPLNPLTTSPWKTQPIFTSESESEGLAKADMDNDGLVDLIGGGRWFKYSKEQGFVPEIIDDGQRFSRAAAGQLKQGGYAEMVFVPGDKDGPLRWYERIDGRWIGHDLLEREVVHGHSLRVSDIDSDGNLDIFCAEMHTPGNGENATGWIFYGDGHGQFRKEVVSTGVGNHESRIADLDGDEDMDILSKPYTWSAPRIDVLLARRSKLDQWRRHVIDNDKPWRSLFIGAVDIDGDHLKDIITGGWWYQNPGKIEKPWQRRAIGEPLDNMAALYDFDNDGDTDILGTMGKGSDPDARFVWAENHSGQFTISQAIAEGAGDFLQGVAVNHFSDYLEVALSWHAAGAGIQMLRVPINPTTEPWPIRQISTLSQDEALSANDIDGDGDVDLFLGTKWLNNGGTTWQANTISPENKPDRNRLADINGDGRLDAVVGFEAISSPGKIAWYENPNSAVEPWIEHPIATVIGPMSLDVGDLDQDGDLDVVVGEHNLKNPENAKLYALENIDGQGHKWIAHIVAVGDEHHDGALLVDIDNDTDLDIISIGWSHKNVLLYENKIEQ